MFCLQEGGLTKEEATEKLRIARPDLFPPPAPRRRGGLAGSYRHRCSQTRPKGAGRPTNVTEEELQTYIATRQTRNRDVKFSAVQIHFMFLNEVLWI